MQLFVNLDTGSPHIGLKFCGRHFEFLLRARSLLVRGLEPKLRKSLGAWSEI